MITVTGSLAFDHIMDFKGKFAEHIMPDKIHQINLSFLVDTLKKQNGGTAGNIAYNLALLKTPVNILGTVGPDFSDYAKFLEKSGVGISNIKTGNSSTSSAFIMTDLADNQITAFYPGAMSENASLTLTQTKTDLVVIAPNNPKAMVKFAKECQTSHTPYMLDPGMQLPALSPADLKNMISEATILIANDYEIALLKEKTGLGEEELLTQVKILITTLGEKGSIIQTKNETIQVNAGKTDQIVDPTGAGDAYRAAFLAGWMKKMAVKVCGQMGSIAACYTVEKYGTTAHTFTMDEFKNRYKENFGQDLNI